MIDYTATTIHRYIKLMDLRSHYPYWLLNHGLINSYPSLPENTNTDVVIMGGGITGAIAAWYLTRAGIPAIVVDRRHIGMGSTAASTAMLQYEIDVPLKQLIQKVGESNACESYLACYQSITDLQQICRSLKKDTGFKIKPSFQMASYKKHVPQMVEEVRLRKNIGIETRWLDEAEMLQKFNAKKYGGILSKLGAELDPYAFTHAVLEACIQKGLLVFDKTEVTRIRHGKKQVVLLTDHGKTIKAKHLIIACGYESQRYIPKPVQKLHATYATVSERLQTKELWYKNCLLWESANPYLYCRCTRDNRVIVGGKDDGKAPSARDASVEEKAHALKKSFQQLFPDIEFKPDFKWAGTFASTKDGLPYIGSIPQRAHTSFALGLGGNGITFSIVAAQIIRDQLTGRTNKWEDLFRFDR